ncbi:MAG: hypothetical protein ACRD2B_11010 [Terriglobia bacterium]
MKREDSPCGLKTLAYWVVIAAITASSCLAFVPPSCVGTTLPIGSIKLLVEPSKGGTPLPVTKVNMIQAGDKLKYEPVHLPPAIQDKAKIAIVLVPAAGEKHKSVEVLEAKPANSEAVWTVPMRAAVVGVVFGPHGLDVKKFSSLVKKDPDLIPELADYAQKTATVNALVETLSQYEQSPPGSEDLNAALKGFSSQYGVALPKLDSSTPSDQQAALLLHAVLPTVSTYNPMASARSQTVQQSAGLAASVASLFYGTPVGLAVGGAVLFQNLRTMIFPDTEFRPAFVEPVASVGLELCTPKQPPMPRMRIAYLWMLRVPDAGPPAVSFAQQQDLALGTKPEVKVTCATHDQLRHLAGAREWQLVSPDHHALIPVKVTPGATDDTLSLDLSEAKIPAGEYHLAAMWDWQPFQVKGNLNVRPFSDFSDVKLTPESADRLVEGSGTVTIRLIGADFEFVKAVTIEPANQSKATPREVSFTLPKGEAQGTQFSMQADIETSTLGPGPYLLLLTQTDGKTQDVSVAIHPPNPKLVNLPLRANLGESKQTILLQGQGLERITGLSSTQATWMLAPLPEDAQNVTERKATLHLHPGLQKSDLLDVKMEVKGLNKPIAVVGVVQVAGPRPKIVDVKDSFPNDGNVTLRKGELPAGSAVSFVLRTENVDAQPTLTLACKQSDETLQDLKLQPGEKQADAQLDSTGENMLFLSIDPGAVGQSGCRLTATVSTEDDGTSGPYPLGRVIRLPQIVKFSLSDDKIGDSLFAGTLTGTNLQMITETGWNSKAGYPVQGIPTPLPDNSNEQTLAIELPWPPPAPGAPVFIWLRGEKQGRKTNARY